MTAIKTENILRNLIDALQENAQFYRTAAKNVIGDDLREILKRRSVERADYAKELAAHADLSPDEVDDGNFIDTLQRGLVTIKAALTIERDKTDRVVIEASLATEKELLEKYGQIAAVEDLPPTLAKVVQRQLASIQAAYVYISTLSSETDYQVMVALFTAVSDVEAAITALTTAGISGDRIVVAAEETAVQEALADNRAEMAVEGAGAGAAGAGAFGGVVGLILGATMTLTFGPVLLLGLPALASVTALGAAAGASFGGMAGALLGWGIAEDDVHDYIAGVRQGQILLAAQVEPKDVEETAVRLKNANGHKIAVRQEPLS